jgi:hypothetical protein
LAKNISLLKSEQHSTHQFGKPASSNLTGFEKLLTNSKAFGATIKNLIIQYKIKGTVKETMNLCQTLS